MIRLSETRANLTDRRANRLWIGLIMLGGVVL